MPSSARCSRSASTGRSWDLFFSDVEDPEESQPPSARVGLKRSVTGSNWATASGSSTSGIGRRCNEIQTYRRRGESEADCQGVQLRRSSQTFAADSPATSACGWPCGPVPWLQTSRHRRFLNAVVVEHEGDKHVHLVAGEICPPSIWTSCSFTQALRTFLRVCVARATPCSSASSKLSSDVAVISTTRAMDMYSSGFEMCRA